MTKMRIGLALFWMGLAWAFFWGIVASLHQVGVMRGVSTFEELNQTIWAVTGPLAAVWGYGPPLGALLAGTGLLLRSGGGWPTAWKAGMGVLLGLIASFVVGAQVLRASEK